MKLISVNAGLPREIEWHGRKVRTSIWKRAVEGAVRVRKLNLDGDQQSDLSVHGGPEKAVYAYPSEHYMYWTHELPGTALPWGAFGENFTTEGLLETQMSLGDRYRIGSAVIMVRTPRLPCFKLAAKFRRDDMIDRFLQSGYSGFYFSVVEEGEVGPGDSFEFLGGESSTVTIAEMYRLYVAPAPDPESLQRALQATLLPESWRERFAARLLALRH